MNKFTQLLVHLLFFWTLAYLAGMIDRPAVQAVAHLINPVGGVLFAASMTAALHGYRGIALAVLAVSMLVAYPHTEDITRYALAIGTGIIMGSLTRHALHELRGTNEPTR